MGRSTAGERLNLIELHKSVLGQFCKSVLGHLAMGQSTQQWIEARQGKRGTTSEPNQPQTPTHQPAQSIDIEGALLAPLLGLFQRKVHAQRQGSQAGQVLQLPQGVPAWGGCTICICIANVSGRRHTLHCKCMCEDAWQHC